MKTWARTSSCVYPSNYCVLLRYGLELPRYQLLPSGYEDLGQCVQLRLSFQLLRYGLAVAALSAPAEWL